MNQLLEDLFSGKNIRASLSGLRALIKEEDNLALLCQKLEGRMETVVKCLYDEDAKTRKNAVLLLGDLQYEEAKDQIYEAYLNEKTLFVKEAYLTALSKMDVETLVDDLRDRLSALTDEEVTDENQKHIAQEIRAIRKILIKYEGITKHIFTAYNKTNRVVLTCNRNHREVVRRAVGGDAKVHPLGVEVTSETLEDLLKVRCFREMLFPLETNGLLPAEPVRIAEAVLKSGIVDLLGSLHREKTAFYYRIECRSSMELDKRSDFARKIADTLDKLSKGKLVNSTGDYEVEIRLVSNKEGRFWAGMRLSTIRDNRFNYRRNSISASIHPSTAALIMELAKPYLLEHAQILDPFCGVGTMLIERNYATNAREMYGVDIFGEAIAKARENTEVTGMRINYIHRDFFDFRHDYKFDEIITNMPVRGKKTKEEMADLYEEFFEKAATLLTEEGIIIMYTNELGFVKKNLRINKKYKLLQETLVLSKGDYYLLIIGRV